jgi:hypothetical protein
MKAITNIMDDAILRLKKLQMSATFQNGVCYFFDGFNDYEFDAEIVQDLLIAGQEDFIDENTFREEDEDGSPFIQIMWDVIEDNCQYSLCDAIDKLITDKKI